MATKTYQVRMDGHLIGTRKSPREYTHAVVVTGLVVDPADDRKVVNGCRVARFVGRPDLVPAAVKATRDELASWYSWGGTPDTLQVVAVPVEVR